MEYYIHKIFIVNWVFSFMEVEAPEKEVEAATETSPEKEEKETKEEQTLPEEGIDLQTE